MKTVWAIIVLVTTLILTLFVSRVQSQEQTLYVVDQKIDNNEQCSEYVGYSSVASFLDANSATAYLCVKKEEFNAGGHYVFNSYFKEVYDCTVGFMKGSFTGTDSGGNPTRINFCVVKGPAENSNELVTETTIVPQCPEGYKQTSTVKIGSGTYSHCMIGGNTEFFEGGQTPPISTGEVSEEGTGSEQNEYICEDSDEEEDVHVKGTLRLVDQGGNVISDYPDDGCFSETSTKEYYCDNVGVSNSLKYEVKNCPSGEVCSDGVCAVGDSNASATPQNCYPRQTYGIGGIFGRNANQLCQQRHGANYACNQNEPPACTGLGQLWPWNWIACSIQPVECDRVFIGVDVRATCCLASGSGENQQRANGAVSKELGDAVIDFLTTDDRNRNPGMIQNIRNRYNEELQIYVMDPPYIDAMTGYLGPLNPGLMNNVKIYWESHQCTEVQCYT